MSLAYYQPTIPNIPGTTRYRHASAIGDREDSTLLIVENDPPEEISDKFQTVLKLSGKGPKSIHTKVMKAQRSVKSQIGTDGVFISGVGLSPTIVGVITRNTWVSDIFDNPIQFSEEGDSPLHTISGHSQCNLLRFSDLTIFTQSEQSPLTGGNVVRYIKNGAPVSSIDPGKKPARDPLKAVVAGKTKLEQGMRMTLEGIAGSEITVELHVFGSTPDETVDYATELGVGSDIFFHGQSPHWEVIDALQGAHVGFCLLPDRRDWNYAYPIKIGEYLATGTIPIATPRRGILDLATDAAIYCKTSAMVSMQLNQLDSISDDEFKQRSDRSRKRAEEVSWEKQLKEFNEAIDSVIDTDRG